MSRRTQAITTLLLAAALAGCGGSAAGGGPVTAGPGREPAPASDLTGRTFLSTSVTKDGADAPLAEGSRLTLSFPDGQVSANAGCNGMSGSMSLDGDTLVVGDLSSTMMGCSPALMEQDAWVAGLLGGRPTVALDGATLTLTGGGRVVTLLDKTVATPDLPLEGTTWALDGVVSGTGDSAAVSSVPDASATTLRITAGTAELVSCNTFRATVTVEGTTATFGPWDLAGAARPCPSGPAELARTVQTTLTGPVSVAIDASSLTLTGPTSGLMLKGAAG